MRKQNTLICKIVESYMHAHSHTHTEKIVKKDGKSREKRKKDGKNYLFLCVCCRQNETAPPRVDNYLAPLSDLEDRTNEGKH